jgi:hypothetical protein
MIRVSRWPAKTMMAPTMKSTAVSVKEPVGAAAAGAM